MIFRAILYVTFFCLWFWWSMVGAAILFSMNEKITQIISRGEK